MYFVFEIQGDASGTFATIVTQKAAKNDAESEYFRVLSYAAVSDLPIHTVALLDSMGNLLMRKTYRHEYEVTEAKE